MRPAGEESRRCRTPRNIAGGPLGEQFAVRGSRPVDQYNFLRLIHPPGAPRKSIEYKFVPKERRRSDPVHPGHVLSSGCWMLVLPDNKGQGVSCSATGISTDYGSFEVQAARPRRSPRARSKLRPEMATGVDSNTDKFRLHPGAQRCVHQRVHPRHRQVRCKGDGVYCSRRLDRTARRRAIQARQHSLLMLDEPALQLGKLHIHGQQCHYLLPMAVHRVGSRSRSRALSTLTSQVITLISRAGVHGS